MRVMSVSRAVGVICYSCPKWTGKSSPDAYVINHSATEGFSQRGATITIEITVAGSCYSVFL